MKKTILLFFLSLTILYAQNEMNPGIHGGVGTDLNLGLAVGIQGSIIPLEYLNNPLELGVKLFYSHSVEISDNGINEYTETTDLIVLGLIGNVLFNYEFGMRGFYYIVGVGVAGVSVEWLETSETDSSLGTPFGSSGSQQSVEGVTGGTILNLGVGYSMSRSIDFRLELPVFVIFSAPGQATMVAPNLTLMAGYRF